MWICKRLYINGRGKLSLGLVGWKVMSKLRNNALGGGIFKSKLFGSIPQVLQENLSSKVRLGRGTSVCLCNKVWKAKLVLHSTKVGGVKWEVREVGEKDIEDLMARTITSFNGSLRRIASFNGSLRRSWGVKPSKWSID